MKVTIYIILFSLFFAYDFASGILLDNQLVKGRVIKTSGEEGLVWINTSQGQLVKSGQVLYVHDRATDLTKAILKVKIVQSNYVLASIINILDNASVSSGDKVNNVYRWDAYRYEVRLRYKKADKELVVVDDLVLDNDLSVELLPSGEMRDLSGSSIKKIFVENGARGGLSVKGFTLDGGDTIGVGSADIDLRALSSKKIQYNPASKSVKEYSGASSNGSDIIFTSSDMLSVDVVKPLQGANLLYNYSRDLPYEQDEEALDRYKVVFNFSNIALGIKALESRISKEGDEDVAKELAANIGLYGADSIDWIGVAGNFNDWDESKGIMTKKPDGSYELVVSLPKGNYEYYFVVSFNGTRNILLGLIDPYSNRLSGVLDLDFSFADGAQPGAEDKEDKGDEGDDEEGNPLAGIVDVIDKFDFIFGYEDRVSVIEVPGVAMERGDVLVADSSSDNIEEEVKSGEPKKVLPYDPAELSLEENELRSYYSSGDVIEVDGVKYYAVTFRFNQLYLLPLDVKRRINEEAGKANPSQKRISNLENFLKVYDEDKVADVSVVGNFGSHSMVKGEGGIWEVKLYIPSGRHWYHFSISSPDYASSYYVVDAFSASREQNEDGALVSIIDLQ